MIKDQTLDEAIIEAARFIKAAKELRAKRKEAPPFKTCISCHVANHVERGHCEYCGKDSFSWGTREDTREHAACKRASLDLTRKLADMRAGR